MTKCLLKTTIVTLIMWVKNNCGVYDSLCSLLYLFFIACARGGLSVVAMLAFR